MRTQTPQSQQPAVPAHMMAYVNALCDEQGIDLPQDTKFAMAREVLAEVQLERQQTERPPLWLPIEPHLEQALNTEADELYFGGRAGCGKSLFGIGVACTEHKQSIFYRTEYSQLKDIILKSRTMLAGTGASFNGNDHIWTNIPGGRTLEFGACMYDKDIDKFRGREHDLIVFDEVATFEEDHYIQLQAWLRTTDPNQRVRVIGCGNPPSGLNGKGIWVNRRWAAWLDDRHPNPAKSGELRWYVNIDDKDTEVADDTPITHNGETLYPKSRTFIKGEMLDMLKPTYIPQLQQVREPLRSQLLHGDFTTVADDQARQVIQTDWVREAQARWERMEKPDVLLRGLGVDVARGGKDQTVISKRYGNWFDELLVYPGFQTKTGPEVAALVAECLTEKERKQRIVIDTTGIGSSPYDVLRAQEFNVDAFNGGSKSPFTDKAGMYNFMNRRAEAWYKFSEALDPESGEEIALPPNPELMADLTAPTWELVGEGIKIESKDTLIKRLGRSPDRGDAVVMNWNIDVRSTENISII